MRDIVVIPAEVKHWHGVASNNRFTHTAAEVSLENTCGMAGSRIKQELRKTEMINRTEDIKRARDLLNSGGYTVVMCRGNELYTSVERGVKPLVELVKDKKDMSGFSAADKVVGRAAAFLYVLLGVNEVHGSAMSNGADKLLRAHGINCSCDCLAERIINRAGTGICPMENAVKDIPDDSPEKAFAEILHTIKKLSTEKNQ